MAMISACRSARDRRGTLLTISARALLAQRLFDAVLLFAVVGTVERDRAADQEIPVGAVLDDEVEIRYLLEIMLDALRSFIGAVFGTIGLWRAIGASP